MSWARELSVQQLAEGGLFSDGDWVESKDQDPSGSIRLTQLADVGIGNFRDRSNRWMRADQADALRCTYLESGDVLIARMPDPIGRACLVPPSIGKAVTAVDVAVLRVRRPDVDPRYVMWAINSPAFYSNVVSLQSGTTRKRISRRNLATLTVPVPPLDEQRRIVDLLEDHLSRLDAADRGLAQAFTKIKALQERATLHALTGVTVADRADAVLEEAGTADGFLPSLPVGWSWARLGEVAEVVGGVTKDAKKQGNPAFVEVPYLRVANVQRGRLNLNDVVTIRVAPAKARTLRLEKGDVLLNEGGDRDKLARGWVWENQLEECIHQNHVFRARVREPRLDPYFLSMTANTIGGRWAERNGKQSVNLASISLSMIRKMPVIVPAAGEAERIVTVIRAKQSECDRLATALVRARSRGANLRRSLLTAAFCGRLTATAPDLSEALETIIA